MLISPLTNFKCADVTYDLKGDDVTPDLKGDDVIFDLKGDDVITTKCDDVTPDLKDDDIILISRQSSTNCSQVQDANRLKGIPVCTWEQFVIFVLRM